MIEKQITPKEFETYLQEFVGLDLTDFYYIVDRLLVFRAGKKYQYDETICKGKKKPIYRSEYELRIWGDWKYEIDGSIIETSDPVPKEGGSSFRGRMSDFAESINPKKITAIIVSEDGKTAEIYLDIGGKFIVTPDEDMFVDYSNRTFNTNGEVITARHARPAENTGILTYFEAHRADKDKA